MRYSRFPLIIFLLLSLGHSDLSHASALQQAPVRTLFITLIPNFENHRIQFDGQSILSLPSDPLDLTGLPLQVEQKWKDPYNPTWNIRGTIQGGRVEYDPDENIYHLLIGPLILQPQDDLKWIFPFVNLDYSQIQPVPDPPDQDDVESRQRTHRFTYRGGAAGREIQILDIPFTIITKKIDLMLTPLVGEVLIGGKNGFRLSGRVLFGSISDFGEFTWHCQSTVNRILHGADYRSANLLYALDYPHYFGPDVLNSAYESKPTIIRLRSELTRCEYDQEKRMGQVEAIFSGRTRAFDPDPALFPKELRKSDFPDGNYPFVPVQRFSGVNGYEIRLGRIVLAPGDTLTITVPHTYIQIDGLAPAPNNLIHLDIEGASQQTQIVYRGPAAFELSLPYVAQSSLYVSQFPAFIRPGVSLLEEQFGELFPFGESWLTWAILGTGSLLLVLSRIILQGKWLAIPGWLLMALSFFYGVRGSFGLLCIANALYLSQVALRASALQNRKEAARKTLRVVVGFALIASALYVDHEGNTIFQGLSEPDLSPITPLVMMVLIGAMFLVFYGKSKDARIFTSSDLPTLVLFLAVLALFDAFNKSLLALLILLAGVLYVIARATRNGEQENGTTFGHNLQSRMKLAFANRVVPVAILILIVFALVNDLSGAYANEMQIRISPLLTPIAIPLLAFASVFLAFTSIALFFVLVYPFLPSESGYTRAALFAAFLFLVFLFGIGTDDRLIATLPNILAGRVIYYFSVPLLIGVYFDINEFMQKETKRLASEGSEKKSINFRMASNMYFRDLQGIAGTLAGILSVVAPSVYAFLSNQPAIATYFGLLEKLVLLST